MGLSPSTHAARKSYGQIADKLEVGNLIQTQLDSFEWFKREGLRELFNEINPITDYTGKNYELRFLDYEFGEPKYDEEDCRQRDMTFSAPLRINTRLHIKTGENAGEIKEAEVFMGDFAMMTGEGTFIVNGTERVVVSQLVRSPGVYFTAAEDGSTSVEEALVELYRKIRPGDPPTVENARNLLNSLFFNARRFDLSKVGR